MFYQNDEYGNRASWPNGLAQLTKKGEEQATKIGEFLRQNYAERLSINETSQIEIRTTEVARVKRSAEFVFKGFVAGTELEKSAKFVSLRMDLVSWTFLSSPKFSDLNIFTDDPSFHRMSSKQRGV